MAADGGGAARTGSLLLRGAPSPLRGAAGVEESLFIASLDLGPVSSDIRVAASPGAPGYPASAWEKRDSPRTLAHNPSRGRVLEKEKLVAMSKAKAGLAG